MVETLSVLALDAADYALLREWGCDNILLENHRELSTFSHTYDRPYTPEVWATVATGEGPSDTGVAGRQGNWDSPVIRLGSEAVSRLPIKYRSKAGAFLEKLGFDAHSENESLNTVFDEGMLSQWPGITEATNFSEAQTWLSEINDGVLSDGELLNRLLGNTGSEFGWLAAMARSQQPISGIHSHILDVAGHVYSSRNDRLREYYMTVDDMVGTIVSCCDELVIISDHGMEVDFLDDPNPGKHSWRAMISTTISGELPESVKQTRFWLEDHIDNKSDKSSAESLDAPEEHLRDLGYFS